VVQGVIEHHWRKGNLLVSYIRINAHLPPIGASVKSK
jgi:hypothetical protein